MISTEEDKAKSNILKTCLLSVCIAIFTGFILVILMFACIGDKFENKRISDDINATNKHGLRVHVEYDFNERFVSGACSGWDSSKHAEEAKRNIKKRILAFAQTIETETPTDEEMTFMQSDIYKIIEDEFCQNSCGRDNDVSIDISLE